MLPKKGDRVFFQLRVERVSQDSDTKVICKKKAITEAAGLIVEGPINGKVYIETTGVRELNTKKWIKTDIELIVETTLDDVEVI